MTAMPRPGDLIVFTEGGAGHRQDPDSDAPRPACGRGDEDTDWQTARFFRAPITEADLCKLEACYGEGE